MTQDTISCELHDFLEVACMYGYRLKLILKNNQIIEGKAVDIVSSLEKHEYLIIDNDSKQHIELIQLAEMEVLTPNAKFSKVIF